MTADDIRIFFNIVEKEYILESDRYGTIMFMNDRFMVAKKFVYNCILIFKHTTPSIHIDKSNNRMIHMYLNIDKWELHITKPAYDFIEQELLRYKINNFLNLHNNDHK